MTIRSGLTTKDIEDSFKDDHKEEESGNNEIRKSIRLGIHSAVNSGESMNTIDDNENALNVQTGLLSFDSQASHHL